MRLALMRQWGFSSSSQKVNEPFLKEIVPMSSRANKSDATVIFEPLGKLMALLSALTTRELSNTPSKVSVLNKSESLEMDCVAPELSVCSNLTAPSAKSMSRARL